MNRSIIIAGVIIGAAIILDGVLDRRYQDQDVGRCADAYVELNDSFEASTARLVCLKSLRTPY